MRKNIVMPMKFVMLVGDLIDFLDEYQCENELPDVVDEMCLEIADMIRAKSAAMKARSEWQENFKAKGEELKKFYDSNQ